MWELDIKKAECQRIDTFSLWCWRRLLRVPWTAKRSNQWVLKDISPEYSLKGLMLRLKVQYHGHLMWRADLFEKTLMLGKIEGRRGGGRRGWDGWIASPTQWTWVRVGFGTWCWTGRPGVMQLMGLQRLGHNWATELNWIEVLHLWLQKYSQSDFGIDHLVMSMCRVFSCVVARGCLLCPWCSFGKTLLAFYLLHSVLQV